MLEINLEDEMEASKEPSNGELSNLLSEIDLDEDIVIELVDEDQLKQSLFLPEIDFDVEKVKETDHQEVVVLEKIPTITIVEEKNIEFVKIHERTLLNTDGLRCESCNKLYKNSRYLKRHEEKCKKKAKQKDDAVKETTVNIPDDDQESKMRKELEKFLDGGKLLQNVLDEISKDERYGLAKDFQIYQICEFLKDKKSEIFFEKFAMDIFRIAQMVKVKTDRKAAMINKFLNLTVDDSRFAMWKKWLSENQMYLEGQNFLYQELHDWIFKKAISYFREDFNSNKQQVSIDVIDEEKQIVRYIAGFILIKIRKKLTRDRNPDSKCFLEIIEHLGSKDDSLVDDINLNDFTNAWVRKVSRGGLFYVDDSFFTFVLSLELKAKTLLNVELIKNYHGQNIIDILYDALSGDEFVQEKFDLATRFMMNEDLKEKFRLSVIRLWVNIRAYAFVTVFIEIMKRKSAKTTSVKKPSERGEASLRSSLPSRK